ncbi:MAG: hypothetical protein ACKO38_05245 [Planctomycetota bacterium]
MPDQNENKLVKRLGWLIQLVFGIIALLNVRVPHANGNRALGEVLFSFGVNAEHGPWVEWLLGLFERFYGFDQWLLNGGTKLGNGIAAGIAVASILVFALLWISRWFDKNNGRRIVERLLEASVCPLFVACALVSPSTSMAMAISQTVFQFCYPPPREVFIIGVDQRSGVVTPPVKVS